MKTSLLRILSVDDEPVNLVLLEETLNMGRDDIAMDKVFSGYEALEKVDHFEYAVILLDICMPGLDGFETAQRIREKEKNAKTPIIFITALSNSEANLFKGYESGAVDYLMKPFDPFVLQSKVGVFLELARQKRYLNSVIEDLKQNETLKNEINEHKKTLSLLKESEEKFRLFVENSNEMIAIYSEHWEIIYANPKWKEALGIEFSTRLDFLSRIYPSERDSVEKSFLLMRNMGIPFNSNSIRFKNLKGDYLYLEVTIRPAIVAGNNIFYIVAHDFSKRKKIEEEKESIRAQFFQSAKLATVGTLSAGIAHELNNPLSAIIAFSYTIRKKKNDSYYVEDRANEIYKAAIRMKHIINHLRKFTRETTPEDWKQVCLKDLLDNSLILLNKRVENRSVSLKVDIEENICSIWGNQNEIESVFQNLIINSMDSYEDIDDERDRIVKISMNNERSGARIIYEDNAAGMSKEILGRIFDPFFTTKEPGKGTGLGMSIIHGIVEKHNGSISVESWPHKGSRFNIFLPIGEKGDERVDHILVDGDIISKNNELAQNRSVKGSVFSILVIDDEESFCIGIKDLMSFYDEFKIKTISDPEKAMVEIEKSTYDLILTDYAMPKFSGLDILSSVKQYQPSTPVVIITGFNENDKNIQYALRSGAKGVFRKTIDDPDAFVKKLKSYISKLDSWSL